MRAAVPPVLECTSPAEAVQKRGEAIWFSGSGIGTFGAEVGAVCVWVWRGCGCVCDCSVLQAGAGWKCKF